MTEIYETQSERTDLPLVVMPSVLDSMIEPIKAQFPALHDVARVRMFEEFTSDEATIAERLKDADALLVGGYHISDDLLRTISEQGHVKCIVFCGTGVASYLNLDKARELKIRVCNAEHYGDHAVAEHTFALLFELIRRVGQLDKDVKAGNWAWTGGDGLQLAGRRMGIIGLGGIMGGRTGIIIAFVIAMIMNVGSYWYSDKIVLSMYQARELSEDEAPMLHRMVAELSANAGIPKPRVCVIPEDAPNAFATGRDPEHGVVAVTDGIMRILSPEELRGVIAHEIGHIANRDILIQTIAGVLASVIVSIANFMQFAAIFGGSSNDEEGGTNPIAAFLLAILAPIAASIIQMAISRSREYLADETGARICGQPLALAGALHKLGVASGQIPMQNGNPSTEQMFIVSPLFGFGGGSMANLFSTHPPLEERIARLQEMSRQAR